MNQEIELICRYDNITLSFGVISEVFKTFDGRSVSWSQNCLVDALDPSHVKEEVEKLKSELDGLIEWMPIIKRFHRLVKLFNHKLYISDGQFHIENHTFDTLDEVEKVWNNKAFL